MKRQSSSRKPGHAPATTGRRKPSDDKAKGPYPVQKAQLQQAFDFFDATKKGYLTIDDLKARLPIFYKNLPNRELKFLMNNKTELTFDDLHELLSDNLLNNFDPAAEAFKIYDPKGTGFVNVGILRDIFGQLGFGEVTDEDMKIVIETADSDKDGKIGLDDFKNILNQKVDLGVFNTQS